MCRYSCPSIFAYRFDYREEWLRFTRSLSEGEPGLHLREHAVRAMAALIDSTGARCGYAAREGGTGMSHTGTCVMRRVTSRLAARFASFWSASNG